MSESFKTWMLIIAVLALLLVTFQVDVKVGNAIGPERVVRRPVLRAVWDVAKTAAVSMFLSPLVREPVAERSGERYFAAQPMPSETVVRAVGSSGDVVLNNSEGW